MMRLFDDAVFRQVTAVLLSVAVAAVADAQIPSTRPTPGQSAAGDKPTSTTVSFELLMGEASSGLYAQQWQQVFAKLGVAFRAHRAGSGDKPEVRERMVGSTRRVTVVGRLDRSGRIVLPDRTFRRSDAAQVAKWIRELKTYGAQGSPEGKQLWGLDKAQFAALYGALSDKLETDIEGKTLEAALSEMQLPAKYPLRVTATTRRWLTEEFRRVPEVRHSLKGLSQATALAIVLNDYGLGFRPLRTPEGTIELTVDPLTQTADVWPVGWEMAARERRKAAAKMFELVPVELEEVKLVDVLHAVSVKTGIPILIDHYRIEARQIDLEDLRVSAKPTQTSWSLLLKRLANSVKLTRELRRDERGGAFVWITTLEPRPRSR